MLKYLFRVTFHSFMCFKWLEKILLQKQNKPVTVIQIFDDFTYIKQSSNNPDVLTYHFSSQINFKIKENSP